MIPKAKVAVPVIAWVLEGANRTSGGYQGQSDYLHYYYY